MSDLRYSEIISTNITHRVFTAQKYINQTEFALSEGVTILKTIEDYLQIPFTLPKLDQAAIPDFSVEGL